MISRELTEWHNDIADRTRHCAGEISGIILLIALVPIAPGRRLRDGKAARRRESRRSGPTAYHDIHFATKCSGYGELTRHRVSTNEFTVYEKTGLLVLIKPLSKPVWRG